MECQRGENVGTAWFIHGISGFGEGILQEIFVLFCWGETPRIPGFAQRFVIMLVSQVRDLSKEKKYLEDNGVYKKKSFPA